MVEWSHTKERINEIEPHIFVEWSCTNKRHKSVGTLNFVRMLMYIGSAKIPEREGTISPFSFYR